MSDKVSFSAFSWLVGLHDQKVMDLDLDCENGKIFRALGLINVGKHVANKRPSVHRVALSMRGVQFVKRGFMSEVTRNLVTGRHPRRRLIGV